MSKQAFSVPQLAAMIPTEADAYLLLEQLRWGGTPEGCPKCGEAGKCTYLEPKNGESRATRTGSNSQRRVWQCKGCRKQFSVLTDTVMHGSKIPVRTWLFVMFEVAASKNSVSAWEISRKYSIKNESAWFMIHRLREAMKMEPVAGLLGGAVQVDETWVGGEPKNRHRRSKPEADRKKGPTDKQPVVSLVHYETRQAHARVVADVTGKSLLPAIEEMMDTKRTHLHTDGGAGYKNIASQFAAHETVDHNAGEYTRGNISTNLNEGFHSQLKRSIDGTHHHVSVVHLQRYLDQMAWMYTNCMLTDSDRLRKLVGGVEGRRLTYKTPVAKVDF